ncbi:MAG TPA: hypothetical protein VGZ02_10095 [Candidatus Baltobacteraceae bacterium]|jgi:hypothetical protein|nr:hypothetical protein [Candidatus Baltobacteraceae bacterium]
MNGLRIHPAAALFAAAVTLAACSGGAAFDGVTADTYSNRAGAATPSPSPTPFPPSVTIGYGEIFGYDNVFTPNDGDTSTGGQGATTDGVPCLSSMPSTYHVHAFVGIIVNGRQLAVPDGIGFVQPEGDITFDGIPNWTEYATKCYYETHTHDASGVIHLESTSSAPWTSSVFRLGQFFHVWGMNVSTSGVGPYRGTVRTYVAQVPFKTETITSSDYTVYTGQPNAIPLYSHTCVWIEVGPNFVDITKLPVLYWYEEY